MTGKQYKAHLQALGLNLSTGAVFLRLGKRTSMRYADEGPPAAISMFLQVMKARNISPSECPKP